MKKYSKLFVIIALTPLFCMLSCSKDNGGDDNDNVRKGNPLELKASSSTIILSQSQEDEVAVTFTWNEGAYAANNSGVTYTFELDVADNNFFSSVKTGQIEGNVFSKSFTGKDMNKLILDYWKIYKTTPVALDARIQGTVVAGNDVKVETSTVRINVTTYTIPTSIIFDTDMGGDYDDVGALTILHALADDGEARILATFACHQALMNSFCIDVINQYYGRPDLPLGVPFKGMNGDVGLVGEKWADSLIAHFPHRLTERADLPDAVQEYRRILAGEPDNSVVVVTVGFVSNLSYLLQSPPDKYSPLDGKQLVANKVKHLVAMFGWFPQGREFNALVDAPASIVVAEQWPTRIIFSGFEIGNEIITGKRLRESNIKNTPAKEVYTICGQYEQQGRPSWDQTAVLAGVRGVERYFNTVKGRINMEGNGANTWTNDPNGKHEYLTWKMSPKELTTIIEDLMMHEAVR
jgi:inosine-uridine nucleoside N-ribohydrolase